MSSQNPILIIGAGLGGLCLAQGLKKASIPFHVYEKDPSLDFRPQGYRIRIGGDGAQALKSNLTPELFELFEKTCGELKLGMTRCNAFDASDSQPGFGPGGGPPGAGRGTGGLGSGRPWMSEPLASGRGMGGPPGSAGPQMASSPPGQPYLGPYTADRTTTRHLLTLGLGNSISYGKEFSHYTTAASHVTAHFRDGSTTSGSVLIGADGLHSPVRRQHIPSHNILDVDARLIYGKTPLTAELTCRFPSDLMKWITLIQDPNLVALFLEPVRFPADPAVTSNGALPSASDYIYWVLGARTAQIGVSDNELLRLSGPEVAALSLKLTESWDPKIRSLLDLQSVEKTAAMRVASASPSMVPWTPNARVTLLGDAVHVMSPAGGSGANTALKDAARLCKLIVENGGELSVEQIAKYEEDMRKYSGEIIQASAMGGKKIFGQPEFEECKPLEL
jgi:2-polyprenyl-6-methoxyphenol hydroxylase-like FAD-dependent oxidoreductase